MNNVLTLRNACGHVVNKQLNGYIGCLLGCKILKGFLNATHYLLSDLHAHTAWDRNGGCVCN